MSAGFRITPAIWDKIHHFASFPQTGVSLQQMVLFGQNPSQGTLLKASQFLAEELPVRLAHRVKELDELPHNLSAMPSIKKVKNWYAQSFEELITFPPIVLPPSIRQALMITRPDEIHLPESKPNLFNDPYSNPYQSHVNGNGNGNGFNKLKLRVPMERRYYANTNNITWPPEVQDYNKRFTKLLEHIKSRHDPTVTTVAQGVLEWKRSQNARHIGLDMQAWLDRFYLSRIGIRFLIGQHVALNTQQAHADYVGIICTKANVHDIVQEAIENARFVCEEHYAMFKGPPVQLICPKDLTFPYVPGHLSHICFELLKNSLRAVVERYGVDQEDNFPPIKVVVVEGKEDITIKISDEGGGIPRSAIPLIWTYMYTTMDSQGIDGDFQTNDFKAPMAGFGYGLPLSRLYARYFGGDLRLISMDGFGTDVYIHLNRLSSSREPLP
ncbi:[Pyruvate dehydrogenase (acetyl-transferring)] kinase, mitochondrial [Psilocybe cubensis]|uniref:[Pyruvate dehydrogenase (Acetyl-transferring)] kinase, mitochondrial n=2 Tax=Psilocybe cubensis TaxID=181762 RepID=A0ACB8GUZ6_PSICU|nr:[Pyruvate dehydrogenase (acetyl-transferring)] kinase, mitochondrial [Psilocybe cubensis]KAH9478805.1 [Pyruvate dehydrogenase (acetyl-transferring)] kinase, mitochondrial [Psilocybe cubensis]